MINYTNYEWEKKLLQSIFMDSSISPKKKELAYIKALQAIYSYTTYWIEIINLNQKGDQFTATIDSVSLAWLWGVRTKALPEKFFPIVRKVMKECWGFKCSELSSHQFTIDLSHPKYPLDTASRLNSNQEEEKDIEAECDYIIEVKKDNDFFHFPIQQAILIQQCSVIASASSFPGIETEKQLFRLDIEELGIDLATVKWFIDSIYQKNKAEVVDFVTLDKRFIISTYLDYKQGIEECSNTMIASLKRSLLEAIKDENESNFLALLTHAKYLGETYHLPLVTKFCQVIEKRWHLSEKIRFSVLKWELEKPACLWLPIEIKEEEFNEACNFVRQSDTKLLHSLLQKISKFSIEVADRLENPS